MWNTRTRKNQFTEKKTWNTRTCKSKIAENKTRNTRAHKNYIKKTYKNEHIKVRLQKKKKT